MTAGSLCVIMKRGQTSSRPHHGKTCSVVTLFMTVWISVMGLAFLYMFQLHRHISSSTSVGPSLPDLGEQELPEEYETSEKDLVPNKGLFKKAPVALRSDLTPQKPPPQPQEVVKNADTHAKLIAPDDPKEKPISIIRPPKKSQVSKLKTKDMWSKSVTEQRQYLQELYRDEPEPTDKAANEFISYAFEAALNPPPSSLWDVPKDVLTGIQNSRPGDTVKYRIAGKTVSLPYGYPDESIFILTASYRDPEAASTLARAFARAAHPDRIFVGIHAQNAGGDEEPERDPIGGLKALGVICPEHPICSRLHQIRVSRAHWSKSEGPTVARALAERHYRNETYVLGIDSHCHFLRGWDNVAIDMFKRIGNDLAIISAYPPSYGQQLQRGFGAESYDVNPYPKSQTAICRTRRVNCFTTISFKHDMNSLPRPKNGPVRVAFFAAGFSFSRGHRIIRVPYDYYTPYLFDGEETSMGVRAWTWGYDLYHPDADIISHLYIPSKSPLRPVFWDAPDWAIQWPTQFGSILRLQKQLHIYSQLQGKAGQPKIKQLDLTDNDKYEAGPRRSPEQFFKWAKVSLRNNWGDNCNNEKDPSQKGKRFCYSENLCSAFQQGGGMPYVPWAEGTEDLFPPMVRTAKYPPKD